jgi:glycine/D-amino acid oxidase-like deaminating enzyme
MWPYRLVTKIWEILLKRYPERLSIETLTPVESISHSLDSGSPNQYSLSTLRGVVQAKTVIHCTNGHAGHLIPKLRGKLWPVRGTMTVQELPSKVENHGADRSWAVIGKTHYDQSANLIDTGLLYLTQNPKSGYFFLGGDRAAPSDLSSPDDTQISSSGLQYLQEALPPTFCGPEVNGKCSSQTKLISAWSGIMGFTADGLPMVGRLSNALTERTGNGEYLAAGYNGYGMPTCWLAGETVASIALGKQKAEYFPDAYLLTEERSRTWDSFSAAHEFAAMLCAD